MRNAIPSASIEPPIHCGEGVDVVAVAILLHHTSLKIYSLYNPPAAQLNLGELFASAELQPTFIAGDLSCTPSSAPPPEPTPRGAA